ncbi:MAG: aminotransferase class I/II-fold pyridoxal phosphate-dependent enzyme [Verrucomicrobiota bacterium]
MIEKPALLGGSPAVNLSDETISDAFAWPHLGREELDAISRLFADRNISTHPVIGELEDAYAKFSDRQHAVAHCNGTSALMAAFWSLGLEPGDRIFVPSATFWASVLPMMWMGLVPVFCESESGRLGLDIDDLRAKWDPRVKAMVIVPLWGVPPDYDELLAFAREKNLRVIEDASHAHGATYRGKPCGSFGDVSVFSLQGDKLAPAGEGGMFLTNDHELYERAICLGDITRIFRLDSTARRFAATSFGIKTRIAPVSAAIGLCQLRKLPDANALRRANLIRLSEALAGYGFDVYPDLLHTSRVFFEFLIRWKEGPLDLAGWREALIAEGCQAAQPRYPLLHEQPFFTEGAFEKILRLPPEEMPVYRDLRLPRTAELNGSLLKLPSFPNDCPDVVAAYLRAIHKVGTHQEEIAAFLGERIGKVP